MQRIDDLLIRAGVTVSSGERRIDTLLVVLVLAPQLKLQGLALAPREHLLHEGKVRAKQLHGLLSISTHQTALQALHSARPVGLHHCKVLLLLGGSLYLCKRSSDDSAIIEGQ